MQIRQATFEDLDAIAQLLRVCDLPVPSTDERVEFLVACIEDAVVACVGWEMHGAFALLRSLAVKPTSRGRGVGENLVRAALTKLSDNGVAEFFILTQSAEAFATKLGFLPMCRDALPPDLRRSKQIASQCCAEAVCMRLVATPA